VPITSLMPSASRLADSTQLEHIHLSLRAPSRSRMPASPTRVSRAQHTHEARCARVIQRAVQAVLYATVRALSACAIANLCTRSTTAHRAMQSQTSAPQSLALLTLGQGSVVQHLPNLQPAVRCVRFAHTTLCPTADCVHICPKRRLPMCNQCWAKDAARHGEQPRSRRVPPRAVACKTCAAVADGAAASACDGMLAPVARARSIQIHEIYVGSLVWSVLFHALM